MIVIFNWKPCAVGSLSDDAGGIGPRPRLGLRHPGFDHIMMAIRDCYGLRSAKFRRVVLCLPGWEENGDKDACWYAICGGFQARRE
jgi:hypothetical protein